MGLMAAVNYIAAKTKVRPKKINVGLGVLAGAVVAWIETYDLREVVYQLKFLFAAAIAPPIIFEV